MKHKEKIVGMAVVLVIFVIFLCTGIYLSSYKNTDPNELFVESSTKEKASSNNSKISSDSLIEVEVKGEVVKPDVYTLPSGSIVLDLINKAGGYTSLADKDKIVQCTKLKDGDCIFVVKKGDNAADSQAVPSNGNGMVISNGKVNLNTATKEELMKLDGIGESRADKIIEYREKNGRFSSVEDLRKVGARIGDSIINEIKDKVEVR